MVVIDPANITRKMHEPNWPKCQHAGCIGRVANDRKCLAHLPEDARKAFLAALGNGSTRALLQGTTLSPELLASILASVPRTDDDRPDLRYADFVQATFTGDTSFSRVHFTGDTVFQDATFQSKVTFQEAQFDSDAFFNAAVFEKQASFTGARFSGVAWMHYARFLGEATFHDVHFADDANFLGAGFAKNANFGGVEFSGEAWLGEVVVGGMLALFQASFARPVLIQGIVRQRACYRTEFRLKRLAQ